MSLTIEKIIRFYRKYEYDLFLSYFENQIIEYFRFVYVALVKYVVKLAFHEISFVSQSDYEKKGRQKGIFFIQNSQLLKIEKSFSIYHRKSYSRFYIEKKRKREKETDKCAIAFECVWIKC